MLDLKLANSICIETDITDLNSLKKAIVEIEDKMGPVDCLINNAGFVKNGEFTELTHAEQLNMVAVNFIGVINTIELILPRDAVKEKRNHYKY